MHVVWSIAVTGCAVYGAYAFSVAVRFAMADRWPDAFSAALEMVFAAVGIALLLLLRELARRDRARRRQAPRRP